MAVFCGKVIKQTVVLQLYIKRDSGRKVFHFETKYLYGCNWMIKILIKKLKC